jgi:hypothetical protein
LWFFGVSSSRDRSGMASINSTSFKIDALYA